MNIKRQVPSTSFFDISKGPLWQNTTASRNINESIQENFYIYSEKQKIYKIKTFYLQGHFIFKRKKNGQNQIADILNATICEVELPFYGAGIRIIKAGQIIEIYGMTITWLQQLRFYCIQQDFANKYSIIRLLGKGTFGKVFKIKSRITQQDFAVKVFEKKAISNYQDYLLITKELQIIRSLNHPGITKFFETYENDEHIFLIYEMVEQGELYTFIKEKHLSEEEALLILKQLLQALLYIHSKGILHRDLKPSNLLVRDRNTLSIAIADFGLAEFYRVDGKYIFTRCGTPGYVAPEVLQDKIYDYKIDIYSAGVILFMMLSGGKSPFNSTDPEERLYQNYKSLVDYSLVSNISEATYNLLQSMLEPDNIKRISARAALNHQVFRNKRTSKCTIMIKKTPRSIDKITAPRVIINTNNNLDKYLQLSPKLQNLSSKPQNNMKQEAIRRGYQKMQTFSHRSPQLSPLQSQTKFEPFP
ncbi:unnamed protein product (macronuclear) [Paramecium tetraurelia]|uniref:non-specific serine/threonine protein kinase n=1 Tax=Paramecium tetraurelia TaxID=5888 RepID=A0CDK7_PARTE|nr:uncharacterized protein GSPATT00007085001 [Paramecium tetraurelia]CAK68874.1 unnamed protein product [Paramecium tetraurelia]|eukprot:XP_001436271.1 hypothetical protein (macronuclear) [Paramecium tetraurelia strain d4-2]